MQSKFRQLLRRDPLFRGSEPKVFSPLVSGLMVSIGVMSKLFLNTCTRLELRNAENLRWILHRPVEKKIPVISYSNHNSTMDDPFLWGIIPLRDMLNHQRLRWSLAAHDMCFTNPFTKWLFSKVQSIPIIRGSGIFQPSMNHSIDVLNAAGWIHLFPEAKVNPNPKELHRFKWGIARLILEAEKCPHVVPIYHCGMEQVKLYDATWPRLFQHVTVAIGKPVDMDPILHDMRAKYKQLMHQHHSPNHSPDSENHNIENQLAGMRISVTNRLFEMMLELKQETEQRHHERLKEAGKL